MFRVLAGTIVLLLGGWALSPEWAKIPAAQKAGYLDGKLPTVLPAPWKVTHLAKLEIDTGRITRIRPIPGTSDFIALGKEGRVWVFGGDPVTSTAHLALDIRDRMETDSEAGLTGVAFHPDFGVAGAEDYQTVFLYYTYKHGTEYPIYDRLSKFQFDESRSLIDEQSEEILIQQPDRDINHNSGDMFFDEEGYLYLSLGDEGRSNNIYGNAQRLDHRLFSGIIRIDVDQDMTRSHPIRRFPEPMKVLPEGYPTTINQHYSIPDDNPWVDESGRFLEEFYAIGLRNPYSMYYESSDGTIWVADVGDDQKEEINVIRKGDNAQWAYLEGTSPRSHPKPDELYGTERPPFYEYGRDKGHAVIGGFVYHGDDFPELNGKYIFGDWQAGTIWSLDPESENPVEVLYRGFSKLVGFFGGMDGSICLFDIFGNIHRLDKAETPAEIPPKLSDLDVFDDLTSLEPSDGIVPYEVNTPLWSDGADKNRWIALPKDSLIGFHPTDPWDFPEGTVFIKHFELTQDGAVAKRLETRFFVVDRDKNAYGITYKWNEEGTEAYLIGDSEEVSDTVEYAFRESTTGIWNYPTRTQCLRCHNENAGFVLGVKTSQMNRTSSDGAIAGMNQIEAFESMGMFRNDVTGEMPKLASLSDTDVAIETRIRSYLDANCSHCHSGDGLSSNFDARFTTPIHQQQMINAGAISFNSDPGNAIVKPGNPEASELWIRDATLDGSKMPPIAKNTLDQEYLDLLRTWILDELPQKPEVFILPNPVTTQRFRVVHNGSVEKLELFNTAGRKIPINAESGLNEVVIDMGSYRIKGLYLLVCTFASGDVVERVVISDVR